jgi:xylan 1,4-beta-xylosidase
MASQNNSMVEITLIQDEVKFTYSTQFLILYGLKGSCSVRMVHSSFVLREESVCIIPIYSLYHISCARGNAALMISMEHELLDAAGIQRSYSVECRLESTDHSESAKSVRQACADLFAMKSENKLESEISAMSMKLLEHLYNVYGTIKKSNYDAEENLIRLKRVLDTIHSRWNQKVTLSQLAESEHLSVGYLSKILHQYTGMTYTEYIQAIRLENAAGQLLSSNDPVVTVALNCGFASSSIFISVFRKKYHTTPAYFRKSFSNIRKPEPEVMPVEAEWLDALLKYKSDRSENCENKTENAVVKVSETHGTPFSNSWRKMLNIGYAHEGLFSEVQRQIRRANKEIGFEYIRFHGILDDDMHLLQSVSGENVVCDFTYVDLLMDFCISENLHPYIELSYVPSTLAQKRWHPFERSSIVSPVKKISVWKKLIQTLLQHWFERYGRNEVLKWRFTTIAFNYTVLASDQNLFTYDSYKRFYCVTYRAVKSLDSSLAFGAPSCFCDLLQNGNGGQSILRDIFDSGCKPDFYPIQCYQQEANESRKDFLSFTMSQLSSPSIITADEDYTLHSVMRFESWLKEKHLDSGPVVIEEWNSTLWQRDLSGDTLFKATWMIKNVIQCAGSIDTLAYWLLTDLMEERNRKNTIFHGGYGLFCANGIPKAGYSALRLLSLAGDEKVAEGSCWAAFRKSPAQIQIYAWNYCHYDAIYRFRYRVLEKPEEAYKVFENNGVINIKLHITDLNPGDWRITTYKLSRMHGSSYDKWVEFGAPATVSKEERNYLDACSHPYKIIERMSLAEEYFSSFSLDPHEIQVLVLEKL